MPDLVDTATVARQLRVSAGWVRSHADELGAMRLPGSDRAPLRFDPDRVAAVMADRAVEAAAMPARVAPVPPQRRKPGPRRGATATTTGASFELLPIPPPRRR